MAIRLNPNSSFSLLNCQKPQKLMMMPPSALTKNSSAHGIALDNFRIYERSRPVGANVILSSSVNHGQQNPALVTSNQSLMGVDTRSLNISALASALFQKRLSAITGNPPLRQMPISETTTPTLMESGMHGGLQYCPHNLGIASASSSICAAMKMPPAQSQVSLQFQLGVSGEQNLEVVKTTKSKEKVYKDVSYLSDPLPPAGG